MTNDEKVRALGGGTKTEKNTGGPASFGKKADLGLLLLLDEGVGAAGGHLLALASGAAQHAGSGSVMAALDSLGGYDGGELLLLVGLQ